MLEAESIVPIGAIRAGLHEVPIGGIGTAARRCVLTGVGGSFAIDYSHVIPGSILLTRSVFASGGKTVSTVQSFVFDDELHSLWSHVGIMGGDGCVWDIMPDQMVRRLAFGDFVQDTDLFAIRSLRGAPLDADLLQAHIEDQLRCDYPSFAQASTILAFLRMMSRRRLSEVRFKQDELICSTFVDRILRLAAGREIFPDDRPPLALPGHFARSTAFADVSMVDRVLRLALRMTTVFKGSEVRRCSSVRRDQTICRRSGGCWSRLGMRPMTGSMVPPGSPRSPTSGTRRGR